MPQWSLEKKQLDLKFTWKISRGQSTSKTIYTVKVTDGKNQGLGEVAGITKNLAEPIESHFQNFLNSQNQTLKGIETQDLPSELKFGLSSALAHLECQKNNKDIFAKLNIDPCTKASTSFALPILETEEIQDFIDQWDLTRFESLKIKVSNQKPAEICQRVAKLFSGPLRVDANEAFTDHQQVIDFLDQIKDLNIEFIEQPLHREALIEYQKLKDISPFPIIADESIQDAVPDPQFAKLFDGINVKLMKAGSYEKALAQINWAKEMGLKTMIGCMVESSLGIASALCLGSGVDYFDLDGFLYFKDEPFEIVTENQGQITFQKTPLFPL